MEPTSLRFRAPVLILVTLVCAACGGGGGAGPNPNPGPTPNPSVVGGIRQAANPAQGAIVTGILAVGDRYEMEMDANQQSQLVQDIWRVMSKPVRWVAPSNPLYTYQFYEDPSFMSGPLFRYTGFAVRVGGVVVNTVGQYWAADGRGPFLAASLRTWDDEPEFLVIASDSVISHAIEHFNGMPIELGYEARAR